MQACEGIQADRKDSWYDANQSTRLQNTDCKTTGGIGYVMKVLMVGPFPRYLEGPVGGVAAAASNLANGLVAVGGVELQVVAIDTEGERREIQQPEEFGVAYVPCRAGLRGWAHDLHGRVMSEVRSRPYDVVHVQGIASLAARLPNSLLTVHGITEVEMRSSSSGVLSWMRGATGYLLEALPRRRCRNVIAISDYTRANLGTSRTRVWSIRNPISQVFFEPALCAARRDSKAIVYGGRIMPGKNVAGLVRAFARVFADNSDASLVIAGPGVDSAYGRHCQEIVRTSGVSSAVTFAGSLTAPKLAEALRAAGTLALPSSQENAPMVIAEALACGTGVVATDVGGISDMLAGLPGCETIPVGSERRLSQVLAARLDNYDPSFEAVLRERAKVYSPMSVARQTIKVYQKVQGSMGSSSRNREADSSADR